MREPIFRLPPLEIGTELSASDLKQQRDWSLDKYGVPSAWKSSRGENVRVGVVDTGCQVDHADLVDRIKDAKDFTNSARSYEDRHGHGTHVAGTIGANDNEFGVVGIAPLCDLYIAKGLGDDGSGRGQWIEASILWLAFDCKCHIISMSLGSPENDPRIARAVKLAVDAGITIVCASGNSGHNPNGIDYPGALPNTFAIASVGRNGRISDFSSRGSKVDFAASGENVLSCAPRDRYVPMSGTSMAAPGFSGIVALLKGKHLVNSGATPVDTFEQVYGHMKFAAQDIDAPGFDENSGWGVIAVDKLIGEPPPVVPPGPPSPLPYTFGPVNVGPGDLTLIYQPHAEAA